jgi:hypothetical protein
VRKTFTGRAKDCIGKRDAIDVAKQDVMRQIRRAGMRPFGSLTIVTVGEEQTGSWMAVVRQDGQS